MKPPSDIRVDLTFVGFTLMWEGGFMHPMIYQYGVHFHVKGRTHALDAWHMWIRSPPLIWEGGFMHPMVYQCRIHPYVREQTHAANEWCTSTFLFLLFLIEFQHMTFASDDCILYYQTKITIGFWCRW